MTRLINKLTKVPKGQALKGRSEPMAVNNKHEILNHPIKEPFPQGLAQAMFGMGCFWGAERKFWQMDGVYSTAVGYAAGYTPNPNYQEVCSGLTGHNEVVLVIFDPQIITYQQLLKLFWENHNPTQGMRQGNDQGTQYRSGIYVDTPEQESQAQLSLAQYQLALTQAGHPAITTEILPAPRFYYAEQGHQQYLAKHPDGYCGLGGMNICLPEQ